jgi:hypothetical protein
MPAALYLPNAVIAPHAGSAMLATRDCIAEVAASWRARGQADLGGG